MLKKEQKTVIKLICSVIIAALVVLAMYFIMRALGWTDISREQLQEYIASTGAVAPLIYIGISFLQVTFVPIPAAITILAGSYVFGSGWAYLYSYIGTLVGAMVAYLLGKLIGRPFVNWLSGGKEKTEEWLKKLNGKENVLLFFMFLFPFFPDDLLCAIAGILPISGLGFFMMQLITRATSVGATLLLMSGEIIPFHDWGLIVLGAVAAAGIVAFILCFKNADKINRWVDKFLNKLKNVNKSSDYSE